MTSRRLKEASPVARTQATVAEMRLRIVSLLAVVVLVSGCAVQMATPLMTAQPAETLRPPNPSGAHTVPVTLPYDSNAPDYGTQSNAP